MPLVSTYKASAVRQCVSHSVIQSFIQSFSDERWDPWNHPSSCSPNASYVFAINKKYFSRRAPVPSSLQQQTETAGPHPRIWPTRSEFHPSETESPPCQEPWILGRPGPRLGCGAAVVRGSWRNAWVCGGTGVSPRGLWDCGGTGVSPNASQVVVNNKNIFHAVPRPRVAPQTKLKVDPSLRGSGGAALISIIKKNYW